jgi:hypothetical protein
MKTHPVGRALAGATFVIAVALLLRWATPDYLTVEMARRLMGVLVGAIVVAYANVVPKSLAARTRPHCAPGQEQAMKRFVGWSLVLGGFGYIAASLLAPVGSMHVIGGAIVAVALAAALLRCVWRGKSAS